MKGLLMKDIYTLARESGIFLVLILFFSVMGNSMSSFAVVYAAMLPITAIAYDERSKWPSLAAMMPYSTGEIVFSKYLLGYIGIALAAVLTAAAQVVAAKLKGGAFGELEIVTMLITVCVAALMLAINLPFMFRLGVERGRIVFFILIAATVFIGMMGRDWIMNAVSGVSVSAGAIVALAVTGTVLINVISIFVSEAFYKKKTA